MLERYLMFELTEIFLKVTEERIDMTQDEGEQNMCSMIMFNLTEIPGQRFFQI